MTNLERQSEEDGWPEMLRSAFEAGASAERSAIVAKLRRVAHGMSGITSEVVHTVADGIERGFHRGTEGDS